jgi:uncharacterized protein
MSSATETDLRAPFVDPSQQTSTTEFAPVARSERLANLDFVRGVALLGILFVNAIVFFGPLAALMDPTYYSRLSALDLSAALLVKSLCQSKFISIFSMLFGYGLLSQIERAAEKGRSPGWFTVRRLTTLALFGLIHALGLWFGDVLFIYALIGSWLLLARGASARTMLIIAISFLVFVTVVLSGLVLLSLLAPAGAAAQAGSIPVSEVWPESLQAVFRAGFNPGSPIWIEAEIAAYRDGPWLEAQVFRTIGWFFNLVISLFFFGWLILAMFFLGGVLWRVRYFAPEQRPLRQRVAWTCIPIGLLLVGLDAALFLIYPPPQRLGLVLGQICEQFALFFLPIGYLSALSLLAERLPEALRDPVASAGRMSLTVYLLETVIATTLAYHWGFRLFGHVGPFYQILVALGIWLMLVIFSHVWLSRFSQGPMEWLWRRLEYGQVKRSPHSIS